MNKLALSLILLTSMIAEARPGGGGGGGGGGRGGGGFSGGSRGFTSSPRSPSPGVGGGGFRGGGGNGGTGTGGAGRGGSFGRMGGSATGTMPAPAYRNSEIRISPRAAKLGAAAAVGAVLGGAYYHSHVANSLSQVMSAAAVNRSHYTPPPSLASRRTSYTRDEGYVQPTFTQMVFNPIYFWLPFNVWHPHTAHTSTSSGAAESLGDFSNQNYREGEIGADELNQLPAWVQASLRLMHGHAQSVRPVIALLSLNDATVEQYEEQTREARAALASWTNAKKNLDDMADLSNQVRDLEGRREPLEQNIATLERQRTSANADLEQAQTKRDRAADEARTLRSKIMAVKDAGWCHTFPYFGCSHSEITQLREKAESRSQEVLDALASEADARRTMRYLDDDLERARRQLKDWQSDLASRQSRLALAEREAKPRTEIEEHLAQARKELRERTGFYRSDSSVTGCPAGSLYVYKYDREIGVTSNPLFPEEVAEELRPRGADLAVCSESGRTTGVYILDGKDLSYRTTLGYDDAGAIQRLEILDGDGKSLETHQWARLADGTLRYLLTFAKDEQESTSIYADVPADAP